MPYFSFPGYNAAGASCATVEKIFGRDAAFIVAGIAVLALVVWRVRKHGAERHSGTRSGS